MTIDTSNFYPMTPRSRPKYIRIKLSKIPDEITQECNLRDKATKDGSIYIDANKGMHGLPQSGLLANELLEERLSKQGYWQSKLGTQFLLVVDNFGVKYRGEEHALHLKKALESNYKVTTDWTRAGYIVITLNWDYKKQQVHLSIPNYVHKACKSSNMFKRVNTKTPSIQAFR